ncbi:M28 family peptidase, partial [Hominisplanchenecus sp.]
MHTREHLLEHLDIEYSYKLARRMEQFRSNEVLGYRPAGSQAEFKTGEMLKKEMESIGLSQVTKDAVTVDGWEFKKAVLAVETKGKRREFQLGAYQTDFKTDGFEPFSLTYVGKGTEKDYEGREVQGKLVLVDINQRDEWWINYPVYQAHLKGAKALIAVQDGGYGEIDNEALNAQDIAGPSDAAAFSISRKDAEVLKELLKEKEEIQVFFDADSQVMPSCTTYNICGRIPGKHPERMILLSAHYDSYFSGFQDDNTAVALMFGIAKSLLESGYQPNNTIVFCAMAAEEWGVIDSDFDWSA